jgi:uncharacterized protein involved in type VI secretion and phage assembly
MTQRGRPFWGKYMAQVVRNTDSDGLGRLVLRVPEVLGSKDSAPALPSLPYAGPNVGLYLIPPQNAWVWAEFRYGNPDYPVWTGCFWPEQSSPNQVLANASPDRKVLKTPAGTIALKEGSDEGITIETSGGKRVTITNDAVEVSLGDASGVARIKWSGNTVTVNDGALEVS